MYITVEQARERYELGLQDVNLFPDAMIISLIKRAQVIVDDYLGQTLALTSVSGETAEILGTPDMYAGLLVRLPRRFIVEIQECKIQYGYGFDDYVLDPTQYSVVKNEGLLHANYGAFYPQMFEWDYTVSYKVQVKYRAGLDPLPDDFLEAFYEILYKVKQNYDSRNGKQDVVAVSNKVTEFRTLNETVKFAKDELEQVSASSVLDDFVTRILNKYAMPKSGIGTYM